MQAMPVQATPSTMAAPHACAEIACAGRCAQQRTQQDQIDNIAGFYSDTQRTVAPLLIVSKSMTASPEACFCQELCNSQ